MGRRKAERIKRGSTRMKQLGLKLVSVWFHASEHEAIVAHCEERHAAVATFVRGAALHYLHTGEGARR